MTQTNSKPKEGKIDTNEIDFAETVYIRDIENRVFRSLVVRAISSIDGVAFIEGSIIDNLLSIGNLEGIKGIWVEQENKNQSVSVRLELNIAYGVAIPEKAQEVQSKITEEITKYTGLHVSSVHVIFKNILSDEEMEKSKVNPALASLPPTSKELSEDEYNDEFTEA